MKDSVTLEQKLGLEPYGLKIVTAHWNLSPEKLQQILLEKDGSRNP